MNRRCPAGRYLAGSLTLAGALTGLTGLAPADAAVAACRWTDAGQPPPMRTDGSFNGVAVPSATEAWAVGSTTGSDGNRHALIEHWNGSAWSIAAVPRLRASSLVSVRSASPASVWAVGNVLNAKHKERTLILHWNGKTWAQQPSPSPGRFFGTLYGVRVVSATNAWAVGDYSNGGLVIRSLILHWNGTAWKQVTSPNPGANTDLVAVAATSARNAWAVGLAGSAMAAPLQPGPAMPLAAGADPGTLIVHWNGKAWTRQPSPSPGEFNSLAAVGAMSAANAWAVGSTSNGHVDQTLILRWNGRTWRRVSSPDPGGSNVNSYMTGVTATSANNAWAVGDSQGAPAFILHWDGTRWQPGPRLVLNTHLNGVAASSARNAWAVGDVFHGTNTQPVTFHCT